jgi:hypothetical protein
MRIAIEAGDLPVSDDILSEVDRAVRARASASAFDGARDLRLRLRQTKNALLCVAAVGFAGGALVTSTAEGMTPVEAVVGALEDLPARRERQDEARRGVVVASGPAEHAALRVELTRLLAGHAPRV